MPPPGAGRIALIAGLGNPGARYADTRHNAGFWFVEQLRREYAFELAHAKRFDADTAAARIGAHAVRVMTPRAFMNLSGRAVAACASFYRIDARQIFIAHDEVDLPPGDARLKLGGGHGGHNGLRDIIAHLGTADFARLRIGVGHPGAAREVSSYVLHAPPAEERAHIDSAIARALEVTAEVVGGNFESAMQKLHTQTER